jgi:hypothetical protein
LWQGVISNAVTAVLVFVVGIVLTVLKKNGSSWLSPSFYGLIGGVLTLAAIRSGAMYAKWPIAAPIILVAIVFAAAGLHFAAVLVERKAKPNHKNEILDGSRVYMSVEERQSLLDERKTANENYLAIKTAHEHCEGTITSLQSQARKLEEEKRLLQSEFQNQSTELNRYKTSQLEIIYKADEPYRREAKSGGKRRIDFYVGVRAIVAIEDLVVEIDAPWDARDRLGPYLLHEQSEDAPYKRVPALTPEDGEKLYHLLTAFETVNNTTDERPEMKLATNEEPPKSFPLKLFTVIARGNNTLPATKEIGFDSGPSGARMARLELHPRTSMMR